MFLFSDTGGGHRSAAEAIIEAMELDYEGMFTAEMVDFYKGFGPGPMRDARALSGDGESQGTVAGVVLCNERAAAGAPDDGLAVAAHAGDHAKAC